MASEMHQFSLVQEIKKCTWTVPEKHLNDWIELEQDWMCMFDDILMLSKALPYILPCPWCVKEEEVKKEVGVWCQTYLCFPCPLCQMAMGRIGIKYMYIVHIVTHIQYTLHICTVQDSHSHSWHGITLWLLSTANESISHFQQECCPNINESIACNIIHCQPALPLLTIHLTKHCFWIRWH